MKIKAEVRGGRRLDEESLYERRRGKRKYPVSLSSYTGISKTIVMASVVAHYN